MPRAGQEVDRTSSRRAQPRVWLRAVAWLVGAGLHPRAGQTTLRVAGDLAARMDYRRGLVLYDLDGTAARLGVSRATVKRHVAVLRELGALVWLQHGTRANLRLPGKRYTATATIYAATIPPAFDAAMGHRLSGAGYEARVVGVTEAGRERAVVAASEGREPPSPGRYREIEKVEVSGGLKDTPHAGRSTASTTRRRSTGPRRSPLQVARDIAIAAQVRPLVAWTQRERLRRLAFALRPLIDEGEDVHGIAAELAAWQHTGGPGVTWRPERPAAYITAQMRRRAEQETVRKAAVAPEDSPAWREYREQQHAAAALQALIDAATAPARTDEDRRAARAAARYEPQLAVDHLHRHGEDDALDLYGWRILVWAVRLADSAHLRHA